MRKNLNDLEMRKCDKRDLLDSKQKFQMSLDQKIDKSEISNVISDFTQDQAQKSFALRKDIFDKV